MKPKQILLFIGTTLIVALTIFVVVHQAPKGERTKTLWTLKDLPKAPPNEQNGFYLLTKEKIPTESLPEDLIRVERLPTQQRFEEKATLIRAYTTTPRALANTTLYKKALSKPYFADSCEVSLEATCQLIQLAPLHSLMEFEIIRNVLDNRPEAPTLLRQLLRADIELLTSSKKPILSFVALSNLTRTLRLLKALPDEYVLPLRDLLESVPGDELHLQQALIAEYIIGEQGITEMSQSASFLEQLFFDQEQTRQLHDEYFLELMKFAAAAKTEDPPKLPLEEGWRIYNISGKLLLRALAASETMLIRKFEYRKLALLSARDSLLKRFGGAI